MKLLHTMLRVGNLDKSIASYTELLGMELLRKRAIPDGCFTLVENRGVKHCIAV